MAPKETTATSGWFGVDRKGLAEIMERRGKAFAAVEIVSNALDQNVARVEVTLEPRKNPGKASEAYLFVKDDDPAGFGPYLSHAYTMFAASPKKADPTKSGRFDVGEKLTLSLCRRAEVRTMTGIVTFNEDGTRTESAEPGTLAGSAFAAIIRLNKNDIAETARVIRHLIVRDGVVLLYNGERVSPRKPVAFFEATLPTEIADAGGVLRRTNRVTRVDVLEPMPDEEGGIYELGIPVVETGDRFIVNVLQKVPLNMERDNVTPAFLRRVRTLVLENCHRLLDAESASEPWAKDGLSAPDVSPEATKAILRARFGDKVVAQDPRDTEANKIAVSQGFVVLHGRSLTAGEWDNVRAAKAVLPAGQVTPSPRAIIESGGGALKVTDEERRVSEYAKALALKLLGKEITVEWQSSLNDTNGGHDLAAYGSGGRLVLARDKMSRYAKIAVRGGIAAQERIDSVLIHEFAHDIAEDHFSNDFLDAICDIGAKLRNCTARLSCDAENCGPVE